MSSTTAGIRSRKNPTTPTDETPVQILDDSEQDAIILELETKAKTAGHVWNRLAALLFLIGSLYFIFTPSLPPLPPLSPIIARLVTITSLLLCCALSYRPTALPFPTQHLETGGPILLLSLLAWTSPRLPLSEKLFWLGPSGLVGIGFMARKENDVVMRKVGELRRKRYRAPTA